MVVLNRIYTRTGDDGTTALGSGERRPKHDLRISSYGTVDETNASIGVARLHVDPASRLSPMLAAIQNDLFDVGADLAVPDRPGKAERLRIVQSQVERLERDIDTLNANLADLTSFVLLLGLLNMMRGGSPNTSQRLMRLRVLLQFVAIVVAMAALWAMGR